MPAPTMPPMPIDTAATKPIWPEPCTSPVWPVVGGEDPEVAISKLALVLTTSSYCAARTLFGGQQRKPV